jgi:hypothetical protein
MISAGRKLAVTTWNIAAINNNPFEYWITYKANPEYEKLMINIENFLEEPGDKDVPVKDVFTEAMFAKLDSRLTGVGWTSVRSYWESDFQNRKIISEFLKVCTSSLADAIVLYVGTVDGLLTGMCLDYTPISLTLTHTKNVLPILLGPTIG